MSWATARLHRASGAGGPAPTEAFRPLLDCSHPREHDPADARAMARADGRRYPTFFPRDASVAGVGRGCPGTDRLVHPDTRGEG
jgi:hypothetical protein